MRPAGGMRAGPAAGCRPARASGPPGVGPGGGGTGRDGSPPKGGGPPAYGAGRTLAESARRGGSSARAASPGTRTGPDRGRWPAPVGGPCWNLCAGFGPPGPPGPPGASRTSRTARSPGRGRLRARRGRRVRGRRVREEVPPALLAERRTRPHGAYGTAGRAPARGRARRRDAPRPPGPGRGGGEPGGG